MILVFLMILTLMMILILLILVFGYRNHRNCLVAVITIDILGDVQQKIRLILPEYIHYVLLKPTAPYELVKLSYIY